MPTRGRGAVPGAVRLGATAELDSVIGVDRHDAGDGRRGRGHPLRLRRSGGERPAEECEMSRVPGHAAQTQPAGRRVPRIPRPQASSCRPTNCMMVLSVWAPRAPMNRAMVRGATREVTPRPRLIHPRNFARRSAPAPCRLWSGSGRGRTGECDRGNPREAGKASVALTWVVAMIPPFQEVFCFWIALGRDIRWAMSCPRSHGMPDGSARSQPSIAILGPAHPCGASGSAEGIL
jgi:hypothetical protein